ncbi:MAG TPA: ABC transporter ATP-binding protein [Candidatus Dormibacteraeota bacterium]|nr:ABC transporter ATP-binding protein [Candidatus Dormibacteraeota bacterium]
MAPVVSFEGVTKTFRVYQQRHEGLKEAILRRRRGVYEEFFALHDVSFGVDPGTTVGIIGSNGAGKSTALKLIARILHPNSGHVRVEGRVSALLELGTGFHPDYTGRENIFLNGALLGLRRELIRRRLDDIIGFAGLQRFIDNPVKTYSSGMYMRLGFAIAVNVDPDVLLVDEVLAVGDADFAQKCFDRINQFRREGKTIVFVSHDLSSVRRFCDRTIWIDRGQIRADGLPDDVTEQYLADVQHHAPSDDGASGTRWGTRQAEIARVELMGSAGEPKYVFEPGDTMQLRVSYRCKEPIRKPIIGVAIFREDGVRCFGTNTTAGGHPLEEIRDQGSVTMTVPSLNLLEAGYLISVAITDDGDHVTFDHWDRRIEFRVRQKTGDPTGVVFMPSSWDADGQAKQGVA